jgi:hypothetical protein
MGTLPAEHVQDGDGVVGHVLSGVGGRATAEQRGQRVADRDVVEVGGAAGVATVEGGHVEAGVDQRGDQAVGPIEAGHTEPHDQQQRVTAGTAEVVDREVYVAVACGVRLSAHASSFLWERCSRTPYLER